MNTKLVLALLAIAALHGCAVYVPPLQVGGLVLAPAGEEHEHREHHRRGHDRDDD